ncbi:efflux RND transporter periplasmic adaptor subunit [Saccharothrix violaceirubra]|uniref:Multidrug efflux pump subunit AcrA (Membrane-fusion protein) n=1 Tax=Saccharothrix violaceirubra TaxID=413306 RepID=A0A7W7T5M4_9PSEU|nr:efflux RND transporter periplasmic adaptor subunit [Saccharothrix violaceirubra]MBB4967000.1 hypothetical protein [Saccharothrix violaceirubra]
MSRQVLVCAVAVVVGATACTSGEQKAEPPGLADRGATMTTAKPTRQDLSSRISLSGKVAMNPVFGLVAPVAGQVRFWDVADVKGTPTTPTRVATVWTSGTPTYVDVPAGSTFSGRLVDEKADVTVGMPIVSAKYAGYGIVAELAGDQAYKIADTKGTVQAQIKNGPGPFDCALLGTIAALPAGTVPAEPPAKPDAEKPGATGVPTPQPQTAAPEPKTGSDSTGLRLVCTPPADVKMVNGASATVEVVTGSATQALVVPVEAVAGGQGRGKVEVVGDDGKRTIVDVVLGLTDGKVIEVKSGLTGDETLAVPGPNLPQVPEAQPGGPTG